MGKAIVLDLTGRLYGGRGAGGRREALAALEKFCSNGAAFWLRLQNAYDLWHAERALRDEFRDIPSHAA